MLLNECFWVNWGMLGDKSMTGTRSIVFLCLVGRIFRFSFAFQSCAVSLALGPFTPWVNIINRDLVEPTPLSSISYVHSFFYTGSSTSSKYIRLKMALCCVLIVFSAESVTWSIERLQGGAPQHMQNGTSPTTSLTPRQTTMHMCIYSQDYVAWFNSEAILTPLPFSLSYLHTHSAYHELSAPNQPPNPSHA